MHPVILLSCQTCFQHRHSLCRHLQSPLGRLQYLGECCRIQVRPQLRRSLRTLHANSVGDVAQRCDLVCCRFTWPASRTSVQLLAYQPVRCPNWLAASFTCHAYPDGDLRCGLEVVHRVADLQSSAAAELFEPCHHSGRALVSWFCRTRGDQRCVISDVTTCCFATTPRRSLGRPPAWSAAGRLRSLIF